MLKNHKPPLIVIISITAILIALAAIAAAASQDAGFAFIDSVKEFFQPTQTSGFGTELKELNSVSFISPTFTCSWTGTTNTTWITASNWSNCNNAAPQSTDTATINTAANQPTTTADVTIAGLTLNSGTTLTIGNNTTSRNFIVNGDVTNAGTIQPGNSVASQALKVSGNLVNNGIITGINGSGLLNATFLSGTPTLSGSPTSTNFNSVTINSGATFTPSINFNVSGDWTTTGSLSGGSTTITFNRSGTQTISGGGTANFGNVVINTGSATVVAGNATMASLINSGTLTMGDSTTVRTLTISNDITNGGTIQTNNPASSAAHSLKIGGNFSNNDTFTGVSANGLGTLNITFQGATQSIGGIPTATNFSSVTINSGSTVTVNIGINIAGNWTTTGTGILSGGTNTFTFNGVTTQTISGGGTANFGNVVVGIGAVVSINGDATMTSVNVNSSGALTIGTGSTVRTLTVTSGITNSGIFNAFTAGTHVLKVGGDLGNTGTFTPINGSGVFNTTFNGSVAQSVTSSSALTFNNITVSNTTAAVTLNPAVTLNTGSSSSVALSATLATAGTLTNNGTLTVNGTFRVNQGGSAVTNALIYGASSTLSYNGTSSQTTTSIEFPSTSGPPNLITNNAAGVILHAARTVSGTLALTNGKLTTTSTNLLTVSGTTVGSISGGSSTSYINGPIARALPASLASGSTYVFPVGKGSYNPFEMVNPTTSGTATIQAEVFDANSGGSAGTGIGLLKTNRYWQGTVTSGSFTNTSVRLTDSTVSAGNLIGKSATQTGSFDSIGGTFSGSTILSNTITSFSFFNIGMSLPKITVTKVVVNSGGGTKNVSDFPLKLDSTTVTSGVQVTTTNGAHTVSETGDANYTSAITGNCASDGTITLAAGDVKACTITNTFKTPKITVTKVVVNTGGGTKAVSDFPLKLDSTTVTSGVQVTTTTGAHTVSETTDANYTSAITGDCASDGTITLAAGDVKACTITNTFKAPKITVTKVVVNTGGGTKVIADFPLFLDGGSVTSGIQVTSSTGAHTVSETGDANYTAVISGDCASDGTITLAAGDVKVCTITNTFKAPKITVTKVVVNTGGGTKAVSDFPLKLDSTTVTSGVQVTTTTGAHTVRETADANYTSAITGDCVSDGSITLAAGDIKACTITNTFNIPTTLVVNSTNDPGDGTCNVAECTLREAINAANINPDTNTIKFAIPGSGLQTITPLTPLPAITRPVIINGYTQMPCTSNPSPCSHPNTLANTDDAVILIELNGTNAGTNVDGLIISAGSSGSVDGSTVKGLAINRFATGSGIRITSGGGTFNFLNEITGNFIGTNAAGTSASANKIGVFMDNAGLAMIGCTTTDERNIISGNTSDGIKISGSSAIIGVVQGNFIGVKADGMTGLGNGGAGVHMIDGSANTIGYDLVNPGNANVIAFNTGAGVAVENAGAVSNVIRKNSIHDNGGLGIDLGNNGVTLNDSLGHTGPNNYQNFPVITTAPVGGTSVSGTLNSTANSPFIVDVYSSTAGDSSGNGEGQTYLGSNTSVATDGSGNAAFSVTVPTLTAGQVITATAIDLSGNTSEFSAFVTVAAAATPTITTSAGSLTDFGSVTAGSVSTEKTYTVSGSNFTTDITVTAPSTDFQVSKTTGSGFGSSITFMQSGGTVTTQTVFVRFTPQSAGLKSGNVTNASTGATTQNVAVTGTGVAAPVITSFTAGSNAIMSGQSTTLNYVFSKGNGSIDQGIGAVTSSGSMMVSPTITTTYTLTVTNAAGTSVTAMVTITIDSVPPVITYTPLPSTTSTASIPLSVTVTDNIEVSTVSVFYAINGGAFSSSACSAAGGNTWNCNIPGEPSGSAIAYYITASDTAGNLASNTSAAAPNLYTVGTAVIPAGTYTNIALFSGSSLGGNVTVIGNLTLGGIITTSGNKLIFGCAATVTGAGPSNYVVGIIEKDYCGIGSFNYPLGTSLPLTRPADGVSGPSGAPSSYSPFTANVTSGTFPNSLTVGVTNAVLAGSDPNQSAARFWDVTQNGVLTADISFTYLDGDVSGNEANYKVLRRETGTTAVFAGGTVDAPTNTASAPNVSSFSQWAAGNLAPTAANDLTLMGRVSTPQGRGISNAWVRLSGGSLTQPRFARTTSFGWYRFNHLNAGETYIVTITSRRHTFSQSTRLVSLSDDVTNVNFVADP